MLIQDPALDRLDAHTRDAVQLLRDGKDLVARLSDDVYRRHVEGMHLASVGAHMRHILDHYGALLDGLPSRVIDYEIRARELELEIDRQAALSRIDALSARLNAELREIDSVKVRIRTDAVQASRLAPSSLSRELDFTISHAIHHYALIAVLCRLQGVDIAPSFGVAPSTLRYRIFRRSA